MPNVTLSMTPQERLDNYPRHPSIRGEFGYELYKAMAKDPSIHLITADLGYGLLNPHLEDFPERAISIGASEQSMLGIAVGLSLEGRIAFCYTITSFYLRAAETIGLYLDGEQLPVKLIGSGRGKDYRHDGESHFGMRAQAYLSSLNLVNLYPETKEEISDMVEEMIKNGKPSFISLKR